MSAPLKAESITFLRELARWQGVASSQDLRRPCDHKEDAGRRQCVRRKLAFFDEGYWRLTDAGREVLRS